MTWDFDVSINLCHDMAFCPFLLDNLIDNVSKLSIGDSFLISFQQPFKRKKEKSEHNHKIPQCLIRSFSKHPQYSYTAFSIHFAILCQTNLCALCYTMYVKYRLIEIDCFCCESVKWSETYAFSGSPIKWWPLQSEKKVNEKPIFRDN